MDKMRARFVEDMKTLEAAIEKTNSAYLKRDYWKALDRMRRELAEYDKFRAQEKRRSG